MDQMRLFPQEVRAHVPVYTEPCTAANQCSYLFFCTLKGLEHPRMRKVMRQNGSFTYFTYHYLRY